MADWAGNDTGPANDVNSSPGADVGSSSASGSSSGSSSDFWSNPANTPAGREAAAMANTGLSNEYTSSSDPGRYAATATYDKSGQISGYAANPSAGVGGAAGEQARAIASAQASSQATPSNIALMEASLPGANVYNQMANAINAARQPGATGASVQASVNYYNNPTDITGRAGYYISQPGDSGTQRLIDQGYSPMYALAQQLLSAYRTPGTTDERFYLNELSKVNHNYVEASSGYHHWGMKTNLPVAANPFEYTGDLALALEKGIGGKSGAQITTPTNLSVLSLPNGLSLQDAAWNLAKGEKYQVDFSQPISVIDKAATLGTMGVYGNLNSYSSTLGVISLQGQQDIAMRASKGAEWVVHPEMLARNPAQNMRALGYGIEYQSKPASERLVGGKVVAATTQVSADRVGITPTSPAGVEIAMAEGALPRPFVSTSVTQVTPSDNEESLMYNALQGTPTKDQQNFLDRLGMAGSAAAGFVSQIFVGIGAQNTVVKSTDPIRWSNTTTMSGGNQTITDIGAWLDSNKNTIDLTNLPAVSVYNANVETYNAMQKQNPIVATTFSQQVGTPDKVYPYGEWSKLNEGAGQYVAKNILGGITQEQIDTYKPRDDLINNISYGVLKFITKEPLTVIPAAVQAGYIVAGAKVIGGAVEAYAGTELALSGVARVLTTPGTGGVIGNAARLVYNYSLPVVFTAYSTWEVTEGFTAPRQKIEQNVGYALIPSAAMVVGGMTLNQPTIDYGITKVGIFTERIPGAYKRISYDIVSGIRDIPNLPERAYYKYVELREPTTAMGTPRPGEIYSFPESSAMSRPTQPGWFKLGLSARDWGAKISAITEARMQAVRSNANYGPTEKYMGDAAMQAKAAEGGISSTQGSRAYRNDATTAIGGYRDVAKLEGTSVMGGKAKAWDLQSPLESTAKISATERIPGTNIYKLKPVRATPEDVARINYGGKGGVGGTGGSPRGETSTGGGSLMSLYGDVTFSSIDSKMDSSGMTLQHLSPYSRSRTRASNYEYESAYERIPTGMTRPSPTKSEILTEVIPEQSFKLPVISVQAPVQVQVPMVFQLVQPIQVQSLGQVQAQRTIQLQRQVTISKSAQIQSPEQVSNTLQIQEPVQIQQPRQLARVDVIPLTDIITRQLPVVTPIPTITPITEITPKITPKPPVTFIPIIPIPGIPWLPSGGGGGGGGARNPRGPRHTEIFSYAPKNLKGLYGMLKGRTPAIKKRK